MGAKFEQQIKLMIDRGEFEEEVDESRVETGGELLG
jgi:hypothetical protein